MERGSSSARADGGTERLVGSPVRMGCLAGGPLPAALYNKHSSGCFVEHLGLHFASSREAFMGCGYTTPFVTPSSRQGVLRSYKT